MTDFISFLDGHFLTTATRLFISTILGGLIGWQREHYGHEAGVRTFSSIALGSCLFAIISLRMSFPADPSRIAAQVVSGIGFIGIGLIIKEKGSVKGLTTAATLWTVSAIGLASGFGFYDLAVVGTVLILSALYLRSIPYWTRFTGRREYRKKHKEE
tara:strand:+ start:1114 stop:1584 length:471 start_codon:yes stop_codon:yes gene_type:complete